ncbi:MAG: AAA family ATPase [Candidatus Eremiobacteraeota bacterium]|nr:AAA family ATPase [Candidatus Eremiobacteraeota bacterium]
MADEVAAWLETLGLARYAAAFAASDIDLEVLPDLTDADLEKLGVSLGHRKKILRALAPPVPGGSDTGEAPPPDPAEAGERRQLTIVFCDLVGSTALAATMDPEDLRTLLSTYHGRCAEVVMAHGGEVAQFLGDGVMAQFGYPVAHEDDAERAVRCALAMIDAVRTIDANGDALHTRVGIATGTEVVGDAPGATRDRASIVGNTPSLAARLQNVAEVDRVVIAASTRRLLGDAFELTSLGERDIKGAGVQEVWCVGGESHASRFAARHAATASEFVGRAAEASLLDDRARHARSGEGQVVVVVAEPGIGKSRIVEEFLRTHAADDGVTLRFQCTPHHTASALYPLGEALESAASIAPGDANERRRAKLDAFVARLPAFVDRGPFADACAVLLALPGADGSPTMLGLSAEQRKAAMFKTFVAAFAAVAEAESVLMIVEDVHWIDPTTLDLLSTIIERMDRQRAFAILTARPEFVSPWTHQGHVSTLALNRLRRFETEALVLRICGDRVLPKGLVDRITERTDGVPLFIEELTKTILESGDAEEKSASVAIPETLRDALTARLDALAPVRNVAQIAAVIGREFDTDIVAEVSGLEPVALQAALEKLLESGLLIRQSRADGSGYAFKHALVRDTAYEGLLRPRRQHLHLKTARTLVASSGTRASTEPEIVAHHLEEGGDPVEALSYWRRASDIAISRSAYRESALHLQRALRVVDSLSSDRQTTELELYNRLGVATLVSEGPRSPAARAAYERGLEVAAGLPESRETFVASWGVCNCDFMQGNHRSAIARAQTLIALAQRLGQDDLMIEALHAGFGASFHVGDVEAVIALTSRAAELYRPGEHHRHVTTFGSGHDPGVCALGHASLALILAGRISEGRARMRECVALVRELDHPFTTCIGFNHIAFASGLIGAFDDVFEAVNAARELAVERKFMMVEAQLNLFTGNALVDTGKREEGIARLAQVLDGTNCAAPASYQPVFLSQLALFEFEAGDRSSAFAHLDAAESLLEKLDGAIMVPEVVRVRSIVTRASGDHVAANAQLDRSIELARSLGTVLLELRGCADRMALATDARRSAAGRSEVEALLARIVDGEEAKDVVRARRMLHEAGAPRADLG